MSSRVNASFNQDGVPPPPLFRPFTRESLASAEARIAAEAAQQAERDRLETEGEIGPDGIPEHNLIPHREIRNKPDPYLEVGMPLLGNLAKEFPPEFTATPIEDLDKYYEKEKTFMVINKRKNIFRFSATNSLFILSPFNWLRHIAIRILVHPVFSLLVIVTILLNCVLMTLPFNPTIESSELIFTSIFTVEIFIRIIARGFILGKFTYLRDPWNRLDFIVIALGYITMFIDLGGNMSGLRTFRVLKDLQTLDIIPGLKTIVGAFIESVKNLMNAIIFILFYLSMFAIVGLQLYMGVLTQKCMKSSSELNISLEEYVSIFSKVPENLVTEEGHYILCGRDVGARQCPLNSTCIQGVGPNPDYGYTSFDNFPSALLSTFRLMTLDYWESLFMQVLLTTSFSHLSFFVVIILLCSFFLKNLILAIVVVSYEDTLKKEEKVAHQAEANGNANKLDSQSDGSFSDHNRQIAVDIKESDDLQNSSFKKRCSASCLKYIDIFCVWDCCACWVRFQKIISLIIFDPFMELFIILCIVMNTFLIAMDHHDMEISFYHFLRNGCYFFAIAFTVEAVLKIIALSPKYYFCNRWNTFDFIIVVLCLLELTFRGGQGTTVFRAFHFFRLAKLRPTLNRLISIMGKTLDALGNLTLVMAMIVTIFAVTGMQLFGYAYYNNSERFMNGEIPRWNFNDFLHSYMIVFRALCGEWIESMWDCLLVGGWPCIPFFISIAVIGNLVVMNLFIALLLSSFGSTPLTQTPPDTADTKGIQEAINRLSKACHWVKNILCGASEPARSKLTNQIEDQRSEMLQEISLEVLPTETMEGGSPISGSKLGSEKNTRNVEEYPADCCSDCCYRQFPFCQGDLSPFWVHWDNARKKSFLLVENKYFEAIVITIILISSIALAAEDVNLEYRPGLRNILYHMNIIIAVLFLLEMLLKWLAYGFKKYFTNAWCWLDFVVVLASTFNLVMELSVFVTFPAFRAMRVLRILRLLYVMSHINRTKVVVNAFSQAFSPIFSVLFVCFFVWLIFAIMGVQLMGGKFYSCRDLDGNKLNTSHVPDRMTCMEKNMTWTNQKINFDNVLNAYLALFQIATFKGWIDIMHSAIDSTSVDLQPEYEVRIHMYLYFVFFIIFGSFFILPLFIGVIVDSFNEQQKKAGGYLEIFMTEDQRKYYNALKIMQSKKPTEAIPRPQSKLQAAVFDLIMNKKFEMAVMILICLLMVVVAFDHYDITSHHDIILERLHIFFIAIFTLECIVKIFALRKYYFRDWWNVFDLIIIVLSIIGIVLKDLMARYFISPIVLRMVRVMKVGPLLRRAKCARGIRASLFTMTKSLPALFNICLLLFIIMFIYAIFGMFFFKDVRHQFGVDEHFNFETFSQSMILLFQISTLAGWDSILFAVMEENDCAMEHGNCGNHSVAVMYLISYLIISFLIIISMYVAVILENYRQIKEDVQEGLTEDDYDMYYETWQRFDPEGKQFIPHSVLSTFLDALEEPFQIRKPNKYKIILMDIPICEGDLIFCMDILEALTKNFFHCKGQHINESVEKNIVPKEHKGYRPISSTMKRQREIHAAEVIQRASRQYKNNLGDSDHH